MSSLRFHRDFRPTRRYHRIGQPRTESILFRRHQQLIHLHGKSFPMLINITIRKYHNQLLQVNISGHLPAIVALVKGQVLITKGKEPFSETIKLIRLVRRRKQIQIDLDIIVVFIRETII